MEKSGKKDVNKWLNHWGGIVNPKVQRNIQTDTQNIYTNQPVKKGYIC